MQKSKSDKQKQASVRVAQRAEGEKKNDQRPKDHKGGENPVQDVQEKAGKKEVRDV